MLDFLFIVSPNNALNPYPPFYFMYLVGYLEKRGFQCKVIDPKGKGIHAFSVVRAMEDYSSRFIGFSAFHSDYAMIDAMAKAARSFQPKATILVGNAHATIDPHDFIYEGSPFDIAVLGEGEETCLEVAQGKEWSDIKGIAYWERSYDFEDVELGTPLVRETEEAIEVDVKGDVFGEIRNVSKMRRTSLRPFMDPVDIAVPAYGQIDMDWYLRPTKLIIRRLYARIMPIFTGRGCPFNCSFCAANVVWKANIGKCARLRSVTHIMQEIDLLRDKYGADFVYLSDDVFGMRRDWMEEWFKEYNYYFPNTSYACQSRANVVTEEMVRELKESCCIQLDVGVESGSQRLLDQVNKKVTLDQVRQVFEWCRKYKLRSFATMMINMPREAEINIRETERFLEEIRPTAGVTFSVCTPYPGTKIYEDYVEPKLKKGEYGLLMNNNLRPIGRFRMSWHSLDLNKLRNRLSRRFKAIPLFERMWTSDWNYWRAVLRSNRLSDYLRAWIVDTPKTFLSFWRYL